LTTPQPDEQGQTVPIELPGHQPPPSAHEFGPPPAPAPEAATEVAMPPPPDYSVPSDGAAPVLTTDDGAARPVAREARPATAAQQEVMFVPLAVTVGDGFKFGCGFFLAMVLAGLVGFVLVAALFVLTGLLGLSLPLTR
jgi:hypothetical protein